MLVIRMQRTGRKGHAMFRVVVQDSRRTPTSGKIVAQLGSYDPHSKNVSLDKEKASFYVGHGAQPSERVAALLKAEGVKLPDWVKQSTAKTSAVRNADKRRSTRPSEEKVAEPVAEVTEPEATAEPITSEAPVTETAEPEITEAVADEPVVEADPASESEPASEEAAAAEASSKES